MQKIIVPIDFSTTSQNAAQFAANLAIFYGSEIWLYHSYQLPVAIGEFTHSLFDLPEMQKAVIHEMETFREEMLKDLRGPVHVHVKAEASKLREGLATFCDEIQPDLVVIGLSGSDALAKLVVGSNTIRIIHELKYPILVVPPKAVFSPVLRIGFACDYMHLEETVPVALLKKIVSDFNASLYILNVDFQDRHFTDETMNESFSIKQMFKDINPEYESIEAENVTAGINQFAQKVDLDWIVVIPKKHTVLQKMFNRSHTSDLLYHTSVPMLCMHL